jgi:hypothetical protein
MESHRKKRMKEKGREERRASSKLENTFYITLAEKD